MGYYFTTVIKNSSFDDVIRKVTDSLKNEGFGVLTEIDVKETFKKKLDIDFRKYKILGACNPHFVHKAIETEDKIGVFLPCNVIVEENDKGYIEVTAVDPIASMMSVKNDGLGDIADEIQSKLKRAIKAL